MTISLRKTAAFLYKAAALAAAVMAFSGLALADTLTGTVTNRTTNKPSVGDDVVLIRLAQGMQELTRTKTDAKGRFTLQVPDQALHLVRVTHDKANYFRPAPAGTESVEVEVFNAAAKVAGITAEADMMRIETEESGKALRVVENFFVKNDSTPPMTQFSDRAFDFYLPAGAVVVGSAALSPGGMPVQATPVPLGDAGHYAFVFPVRPGETRFQISYRLPYNGSLALTQRPSMATDAVLVMMPQSMKFAPDPAAGYAAVTEDTTAQTFVVRNVAAAQAMGFTVSGSGQLPRDTGAQGGGDAAGSTGAPAAGSAAADTRPGGGLGTPLDPEGTNDPWAKYKGWIIGGLGLLLAAGAGIMLKGDGGALGVGPAVAVSDAAPAAAAAAHVGSSSLLGALKDELFALETDRLQGRLSEAEFVEQRAALEVVLRRALSRGDEGQA